MTEQGPLPRAVAFSAVARSVAASGGLLLRGRVRQPHDHVGTALHFADGTTARVYRETVVDRPPATDPCILVVAFQLRAVRGRGHTLFRWESLFNTPLFVGFPGLISKLWLAHDSLGTYRGLYEWDGADSAAAYAGALWRVLELVSVPGSIRYQVVPRLRRTDLLSDPHVLNPIEPTNPTAWWRLLDTRPAN